MVEVIRDLAPLLAAAGDAEHQGLLEVLLGTQAERQAHPPDKVYWLFKAAGVELLVEGGHIDTFFLHPIPPPGYQPFRGELIAGRRVPADRSGVRAILGLPAVAREEQPLFCDHDESGWRHEPHPIGVVPPSDLYTAPGYRLLCGYVSAADSRLKMITLMLP